MKSSIVFLATVMLFSSQMLAQEAEENQSEEAEVTAKPEYWEAKLDGGEYVVALKQITSVSRHTYVLDGALIVDEVTVDTEGQALARFYYISPVTLIAPDNATSKLVDRGLDATDRAAEVTGLKIQDMVAKKYPLTTHARSIEYRILSSEQLGSLFESAKSAWQSGKGRIFTGL